jgi:type I restriction-modification system DNA methylase subunit
LDEVGIPRVNIKRNVTTETTGRKRGDLWIGQVEYDNIKFEESILALIECKDHNCTIGDADWDDAKRQGVEKSEHQKLSAFFVTNTDAETRCYNSITQEEILIDGEILNFIPSIAVLRAIETQVSERNSNVLIKTFAATSPDSRQFRTSLWNLRQTFRSKGISKGSEDSMIKTTLTFGILKLISEQQALKRTLPTTIYLWNDWREGQYEREMKNTIRDLLALSQFKHLEASFHVDERLDNVSCKKIIEEFNRYSLYASDFDFFGLIYESMANKEIKKDFGEFYTPRHIIRSMVKLLLKGETAPRPLAIGDPACGTGGYLVESFLYLQRLYEQSDSLDAETIDNLKNNTFYGLDTNGLVAIPFARTNMLMADDGGANISVTEDSLIHLDKDKFDYVLANVPYGAYSGDADINNFSFTNSRRLELLFLEKIVDSLKDGGSAAVIVPDGLIESTSNHTYRKRFLRKVNLTAVISLPQFVFEPYTTEKTYILYFTKKMPSAVGVIQESPVWHFIIDQDGFKKGKKRYPITAVQNKFSKC